MKLENQVCSLELSRKLDKLGVKQDSLYYWLEGGTLVEKGREIGRQDGKPKEYSAFTVAELGEMLPDGYKSYFCNKKWCMGGEESPFPSITEKTEADIRAKMLIYLKENKLT